jgi:hypothetical protein
LVIQIHRVDVVIGNGVQDIAFEKVSGLHLLEQVAIAKMEIIGCGPGVNGVVAHVACYTRGEVISINVIGSEPAVVVGNEVVVYG